MEVAKKMAQQRLADIQAKSEQHKKDQNKVLEDRLADYKAKHDAMKRGPRAQAPHCSWEGCGTFTKKEPDVRMEIPIDPGVFYLTGGDATSNKKKRPSP